MKRFLFIVLVASLCAPSAASAGKVILTPPTFAQGVAVCNWLSVHPKPVDGVLLEMVDDGGVVIASAGPLTLAPNNERIIGFAHFGPFYCRATRTTGGMSPRKTLATACTRSTFDATKHPCRAAVTSN